VTQNTSSQTVELKRAFMTSSQELVRPFTFAPLVRDAERKVRAA
jgi:hypothetical protein